MAPNDTRKQKTSSKEESAYVEPWRNLPEKIFNFLKKQPSHSPLAKSIGSAGVSKSWRCASKKCDSIGQSPWLELSNEPQYYCKTQQHSFNLSFEEAGCYWWHDRRRPRYDPWKHFHYFLPWLNGENIPVDCCFLNNSKGYAHWAGKSFMFPFLNSHPYYSPFVGSGYCCFPPFVVYELGKTQKWMKQESSENGVIDPNDPKAQLIQFSNAIIFEGKFYALSLQETLAVIEESDESQFQLTRLSRKQAIPWSYSKHFIECFLESNGEILLIFLISEKSNKMVDKVEVFKLQIEDLSWLKLENLGDRTLFVGINCSASVPASQAGCRSNCVYFTHNGIDGWRLYDMKSDCILPCYDNAGSEIKIPAWEDPETKESLRRHRRRRY